MTTPVNPDDAKTSLWASRAAIGGFVIVVQTALLGGTWYACAKVTTDAVLEKYDAASKGQTDDQFRGVNTHFAEIDRQLQKLMFMACTTPPLGRCTADGVPK